MNLDIFELFTLCLHDELCPEHLFASLFLQILSNNETEWPLKLLPFKYFFFWFCLENSGIWTEKYPINTNQRSLPKQLENGCSALTKSCFYKNSVI